jgi:hypothetical protein
MTVFRPIHEPDWSQPTILAPLLHKIMFCLGLSYVKGGAILGHNKHILSMKTKCQDPLFQIINPFSSFATNTSIYHVLIIMPPLLHIFAPYRPWHNLQQFKYSKKIDSLYFLNRLMCKLLLHCLYSTYGKSQAEDVDGRRFDLQYASWD